MAFPAPVETLPDVRRSSLDRDPLPFHIPRSTLSEVAPQTPAIIQTLDALLEVADDRYLILVRVIDTDAMTEFVRLRLGAYAFRS